MQRAVTMIPAHDSSLAALAFNNTGTRLATASEKVYKFYTFTFSFYLIMALWSLFQNAI